jgi:hypothetical protein
MILIFFPLHKTTYPFTLSRYAPFLPQKNLLFPVEGVHVSGEHYCNEKRCSINLDNLNTDSSGAFRCEVSGDAPEFRIVHETNNMTVIGERISVFFAVEFS